MLPYFALLFIPLFYHLYSTRGIVQISTPQAMKYRRITILLFFSIFFCILAFRGITCGVDLKNYQYYYNLDAKKSIAKILNENKQEVLFHIFNYLVASIHNDYQFYLALIALICVIPYTVFFIQESDHPYMSLVLFVTVAPFSMFFSGLRQSMAMALVPIAYYFCKKNKLVFFVLTVAVAMGFHQSAFILFLMYPIERAKITKKWLYFVVPLMLIVLLFNQRLYTILVPLTGDRYYERYGEATSTGAYTIVLLLFAFTLVSVIFPDSNKMDEKTIGIRNLLLLCTTLQCFAPANFVAMRMNYYFLPFVAICIPNVLTRSKERYKQVAVFFSVALVVALMAYYFFNAYNGSDTLNIYPYVPYWKA